MGGTTELIRNAVLIAGPTASGKSSAAFRLAEVENGLIVNADSMQVYDVLRVLTARPSSDEVRRVPHQLYGHVSPAETYSVGMWLRDVERLSQNGAFEDRMPIFVGGTGLYFRALLQGLAVLPNIPSEIPMKIGDSVWTTTDSYFPPDILVGTIKAVRKVTKTGKRILYLKPAANFRNLQYVYVVDDSYQNERRALEARTVPAPVKAKTGKKK